MSLETILTNEFCVEAMKLASIAPESLTAEQARYIIYFEENPTLCVEEGSKMVVTCNEHTCVNPEHVKIVKGTDN